MKTKYDGEPADNIKLQMRITFFLMWRRGKGGGAIVANFEIITFRVDKYEIVQQFCILKSEDINFCEIEKINMRIF